MSIVLGIGMALSFTVIVPFANDVGEAQSYSMREIFYYVEFYISIANNGGIIFRGIIFKELVSNYPLKFAIVSSSLIWMLAHSKSFERRCLLLTWSTYGVYCLPDVKYFVSNSYACFD